ncbi:MAG: tautomerase PptA [Macellibacteroides sp.]|uniref:tautomerase PptA n=1 Tax=Macellibacteroides sp. TaxID=2014584 RepID=UPI003E6F5E0E
MPHINIKCYPKHLSEQEFKNFITDLTELAEKHLNAGEGDISINYTEVPAENWKVEVYDKDIKPNLNHLAKKPGYEI